MTELADLFKTLSHGVYVIGVSDGEHHNAFTAAWVMQVSFNPPLLAISINPSNYSYQLLQAGKICSVNVLTQQQYTVAEHFGKGGIKEKMAGYDWLSAETGAPILANSLAYFDCRLSHVCDAGDHKLAICQVIAAAKLQDGKPLLYNQTGDLDKSDGLYGKGE
jgi:flavin reductase (DIM6/NTAB) family NADH-FMN oxidoreductase RutF